MEETSNVERKLDVTPPDFIWGNINLQIENNILFKDNLFYELNLVQ